MKKFIERYEDFRRMKNDGFGKFYRFCWIPFKDDGGLWSVVELFDDELHRLDKNKIEVVIK